MIDGKKEFNKMLEELKKDWEREFDEKFPEMRISPKGSPDVFLPNAPRKMLKDFISSLLAKQQEEFVKALEEARDDDSCECDNCNRTRKFIADIKSKLKI